uniref:Uncharacterized protein n=1 Tax=Theropithecus gelada TaxID=9565 RepID=A0A8D2FFS5_THEGE
MGKAGLPTQVARPRVCALDSCAAPLTLARGPFPHQDVSRIVSSLLKALKLPYPSSGWDSVNLMDINSLLALVEDVICPQNTSGQVFWEEAKMRRDPVTLTVGSSQMKEKTQCPKPKVAGSGPWKDSAYRQCLYLQLEHVEQELRLVGPQGFPQHHSHARALRQLQTLKGCLGVQPGTWAPAHAR